MFDTLQRRRRNRIVLRTVMAIVGTLLAGLMAWIATDFDLSISEESEVLVCNGADCSWFPTDLIEEVGLPNCRLVEDIKHPSPFWDCPPYSNSGGR